MILNKFSEALHHRVLNKTSLLNPVLKLRKAFEKLYATNNVNICYNKFIRDAYDPKKQNILIAIESPAYFEYYKWIDPNMKFVAEISFQNYFKLKNYLCPRTIYANSDNFVEMDQGHQQWNKKELVSMVYSDKQIVSGHRMRHDISRTFHEKLHLFGQGTGRYLKQKSDTLLPYMFQVVIENGKYPEYVTEKFFDCLKTNTIPIYWGGEEAIQKMGFDKRGIIFFDKIQDLGSILEKISPEYYQKALPYVNKNRERLIEIRNEEKLSMALHSLKIGYHQTISSYKGLNKQRLNLSF
jgi:hypothetical protein